MLKCAPALLRLQNYKTVYGMASKYISNESLRRVFSFQPLLVGGNPFNTTSIYSLIFYLERHWGVQFAMGGTGAIVRGLERLMREEGIEILLDREVNQINIGETDLHTPSIHDGVKYDAEAYRKNASVITVHTKSGWDCELEPRLGDVLVCNADTPHVYENLIAPKFRKGLAPKRLSSMKYSMGLFVLYFGTTKPYPEVAHHTIVLGHAYKAAHHQAVRHAGAGDRRPQCLPAPPDGHRRVDGPGGVRELLLPGPGPKPAERSRLGRVGAEGARRDGEVPGKDHAAEA